MIVITAPTGNVGFTRPAARAIRSQGVKRVVDVSALGRDTKYAGQAGHVTASLDMDDLIAGTGVAFRALATGQEEVPVLGPEDLSGNDMAAILSEVLGTPVRHQQLSLQASGTSSPASACPTA
jgi:uncharacterized protein YbjT (DUF2867 family)